LPLELDFLTMGIALEALLLVEDDDLEALLAEDLEALLVLAVDVLEVDFLLEDFFDWFGSFGI